MALLVLLGAGLFLVAAVYGVGSTRTPPAGSAEVVLAAGGSGASTAPQATITPSPSPGDTSPPATGPATVALPQVQSVGRSVQQSSVTKLLSQSGSTGQSNTSSSGGSVEAAGPITVPNTGGSTVSGPTDAPPAQPVTQPSPTSNGTGAHTVPVPAPSQTAPLGGLLGHLLNPVPKPSPSPPSGPTSTVTPTPSP